MEQQMEQQRLTITLNSIISIDPTHVPQVRGPDNRWSMTEVEHEIFYKEVNEGHAFILLSTINRKLWTIMSTTTAIKFDNISEDVFSSITIPRYC